ncbi:MAG: biotin/lipoyl-binding protein [Thermoleophilia bacterium]|nr:biotin/lipoyl-binding protein [Thermoleophilia bacterium]
MKFKMQVDGAEHQVEATADGRVMVAGQVYETKVTGSSEDRRVVQLGDKTYEVRVAENCADTGIYVLELSGERIPVTVSEVSKGSVTEAAAAAAGARQPASGAAAASTATGLGPAAATARAAGSPSEAPEEVREGIWAPVPGKIVDVFVKVGDTVKEGDAVLVLEAMKMENELRAPATGTVTAVMVKKGDQAERGQLLVALE